MQCVIGADAERCLVKLAHRRAIGSPVALHHLFPQTEPRENVRRHVQGMRNRRGDPGVNACGRQPLRCKIRIIVGVNQVMRHAGMGGIFHQQWREDRACLELISVGLIGRQRGGIEDQGIQDLRLDVVGIAVGYSSHRLLEGNDPLPEIHGFPILQEHGQCCDVVVLALAARAEALRLRVGCRRRFHRIRICRPCKRVAHGHEGIAPVRHRALRVQLEHLPERLLSGIEPERVKQRHAAIEFFLRCGIASHPKIDLSELFRRRALWRRVIVVRLREHPENAKKCGENKDKHRLDASHDWLSSSQEIRTERVCLVFRPVKWDGGGVGMGGLCYQRR